MVWTLGPDRPIYLQLKDIIVLMIISGRHPPGSKLPGVRELASEASVNPNTMQRALTELERDGLVQAERTVGRFVIDDVAAIERKKSEIAFRYAEEFLVKMRAIGMGASEVAEMILRMPDTGSSSAQGMSDCVLSGAIETAVYATEVKSYSSNSNKYRPKEDG